MFVFKKEAILMSVIGGLMLLVACVGLFNAVLDSRVTLLITMGILGAGSLGFSLQKFRS